jgi:2-phospho-L-lactate/phosphoenolpyruvate guanylyltransferase
MTPLAVIPFRPMNPKSRLGGIMSREERELFAAAMLNDVLRAVTDAGCTPLVLATTPYTIPGVHVRVTEADLSTALNTLLCDQDGPVLIMMADIPLATKEAVIMAITTRADVAIVPGRGGGTNAIYLQQGRSFFTDYYGQSFMKHCRIAQERHLSLEVVDSFRLYVDIDEEEDLVDLLIHGTGESATLLRSFGFQPVSMQGRVSVARSSP